MDECEVECEICGDVVDVQKIDAELCDDDCRFGCNHPTEVSYVCTDCLHSSNLADDRAYRRAEQGYCE